MSSSSAPSFSDWFAAQQTSALPAPAASPASSPSLLSLSSLFGGSPTADAGASASAPPAQAPADASASLFGLGALLPSALGGGAGAPADAAPEWTCGMTSAQRFQAFGLLLVGSLALYFAAIFLFLPMVIFMPAKFATTFTFASIMWMAAFAILRGPRATLRGLVGDRDKRGFTAAYLGSLALTLYSTMFTSSYFLPLVAIAMQVSAAMWYSSSYIPGGQAAMGALSSWCVAGITGRSVGVASWASGAIARTGMAAVSGAVRGAGNVV